MKPTFSIVVIVAAAAAAAPDPLITPRAELASRQDSSDPALLGWVDAPNGQFSDQRSCDFPATLSSSGALAQCCASSSCTFWQSCSAGTLFSGQSTSLFCDQGFCNTAVIVPTVGASSGVSYLGCWATSLGGSAFTIVRDIGNAPVATASSGASAQSSAKSSAASSKATTSAGSSAAGSASATQSSAGATQSTGVAATDAVQPLTGVFGLVAVLFGML
ncbi:Nn.00g029190.m01.CDS01 [Neocucurbitaria sp. VM-36]